MVPPRIPASTWSALGAVLISWFWMATLVSHFGPVQQVSHFYDLGTVLLNPSWLVHGIARWHTLEAFVFGTSSAAVLLAPLLAHRLGTRSAWLLYAAPLALMLICGGLLYRRTSGPYVTAGPDTGAVGAFLAQLANEAIGKAADTIASHISIGAGGYVSFLAALYLAFRGISGWVAGRRGIIPRDRGSTDTFHAGRTEHRG
jgi:hypothetical protein